MPSALDHRVQRGACLVASPLRPPSSAGCLSRTTRPAPCRHIKKCRPQAPEDEQLLPAHTSGDAMLGLGRVNGFTTTTLGRRRDAPAPGGAAAAVGGAAGPFATDDEAEDEDEDDGVEDGNGLLKHVLSSAEPPAGTTSREARLAIAFAFSVPHVAWLWRTLGHLRGLLEQEELLHCKQNRKAAGPDAVKERVMVGNGLGFYLGYRHFGSKMESVAVHVHVHFDVVAFLQERLGATILRWRNGKQGLSAVQQQVCSCFVFVLVPTHCQDVLMA